MLPGSSTDQPGNVSDLFCFIAGKPTLGSEILLTFALSLNLYHPDLRRLRPVVYGVECLIAGRGWMRRPGTLQLPCSAICDSQLMRNSKQKRRGLIFFFGGPRKPLWSFWGPR